MEFFFCIPILKHMSEYEKDNSLDMQRANVYEFYRDVHGFKPRHIKWDSLSAEELDEIEKELVAIYKSDWHQQKMRDESDDLDHELLMYKYDDEDEAMKAKPHPDDFYDTMDFGKDKAKLRDFNPHLESLIRKLVSEQIGYSSNKKIFDIFYDRFPNKQSMMSQENIIKALADAYEAGKTER